jgi:hypothetical protein
VSRHRQVGVLEHFQPSGIRATTHVPQQIAEDLVQRMVAERVSQRLIRMLPPGSIFPVKAAFPNSASYIPEKLPPVEVEGTYFEPPASADNSLIPRMRHLPRYREVYGENQLQASL